MSKEKEDTEIEEKGKKAIPKIKQKPFTKNIYIYLEITIIALVFTCFGLWIGRKLFIQRKRKLNELVDVSEKIPLRQRSPSQAEHRTD